MTINGLELLQRAGAVVGEAVTAAGYTPDVHAHFWVSQGNCPFVTCRYGQVAVDGDSEDFDADTANIFVRVVIGNAGENYKGDLEEWLAANVFNIKNYINARERLQSAAYPLEMDDLDNARCVNVVAYSIFSFSPSGAPQVGAEFAIRAELRDYVSQAYL